LHGAKFFWLEDGASGIFGAIEHVVCMKGKFAQASLEFLVIFAGVMLAIAVIAAIAPSQAIGSQEVREKVIARTSAEDIARACDEVYLSGEGARQNIWIEIPESAALNKSFFGGRDSETNWSKRKMIDINLMVEGDVFAITRAPTCGRMPSSAGRQRVSVEYNSSGTAHVMVNGNC
jgi:hypothetical protein